MNTIKIWAVRYYSDHRPLIAISSHKKCPKFNKSSFYTFVDPNYYDLSPKDLGNIKLPLNKPVRLKIIVERI